MKVTNDRFSVGVLFNRTRKRDGYDEGVIGTRYGFVAVYAQGSDTEIHGSRLDFIWNGACYIRSFNKRYTHRGLAKKAREFAAEIAAAPAKEGGE